MPLARLAFGLYKEISPVKPVARRAQTFKTLSSDKGRQDASLAVVHDAFWCVDVQDEAWQDADSDCWVALCTPVCGNLAMSRLWCVSSL